MSQLAYDICQSSSKFVGPFWNISSFQNACKVSTLTSRDPAYSITDGTTQLASFLDDNLNWYYNSPSSNVNYYTASTVSQCTYSVITDYISNANLYYLFNGNNITGNNGYFAAIYNSSFGPELVNAPTNNHMLVDGSEAIYNSITNSPYNSFNYFDAGSFYNGSHCNKPGGVYSTFGYLELYNSTDYPNTIIFSNPALLIKLYNLTDTVDLLEFSTEQNRLYLDGYYTMMGNTSYVASDYDFIT